MQSYILDEPDDSARGWAIYGNSQPIWDKRQQGWVE